MYNTFDFQDILFDVFRNDAEICMLLDITVADNYELLNRKLRREDLMPNLFDGDTLDFIAFYFIDADVSGNYLANSGLLRLDIYSRYRNTAGLIRKRCVDLIHNVFDIRIIAEGQTKVDVADVYKYRIELLPLVQS